MDVNDNDTIMTDNDTTTKTVSFAEDVESRPIEEEKTESATKVTATTPTTTPAPAPTSAPTPAPPSPKVSTELQARKESMKSSADWNSLLLWARKERGPYYCFTSKMYQVDRNSNEYWSGYKPPEE